MYLKKGFYLGDAGYFFDKNWNFDRKKGIVFKFFVKSSLFTQTHFAYLCMDHVIFEVLNGVEY